MINLTWANSEDDDEIKRTESDRQTDGSRLELRDTGATCNYRVFFLCSLGLVGLLLLLLLAVVVGHGDDRQDEVDEVERAHEYYHDEEQHVDPPVGTNHLPYRHHTTKLQQKRAIIQLRTVSIMLSLPIFQ